MRSSGRVGLDWCSLYTLSYSPVIIADDANIDVAARRIIWGKLLKHVLLQIMYCALLVNERGWLR